MITTMLLEMAVEADRDRIAIGTRDEGLSYGELLGRARRVAAAISRRGFTKVAFLGLNGPDLPVLLFGAGAAGAAFVPLNYRLTDQQLQESLLTLAPIAVVVGAGMEGRIGGAPGIELFSAAELADPSATDLADVDPSGVAVLLPTSGTSGPPKVAVLRHRHLVPYVISTVDFASAGPDEAILISVPPYHIAGISSVLTSVYSGRRMVQLASFSPEVWVDRASAEGVTQAMVVPTMLGRILDVLQSRGAGLPMLRHLSYGGGRMPMQTVERALRILPEVDFVNAYGLTETSSTISLLTPQDHRDAMASNDPVVRARLGSVGRALPSIDLQVRDEQRQVQPAGQAGEIWVRGEQVSGEYVTHCAVDGDGWYPTRDLGHLDAGGFLFLDGRADDVIVRGGENISPGEIEDVLMRHVAVADAAVLGLPDGEWGERIEAVIVAAAGQLPDEHDLQEWVRQHLRSTRVPARIHFRSVLPSTETGKLLRRVLRAELVEAREERSTR